MMYPIRSMPESWGTIGSAIITFVFFSDMFRRYCPPELRRYLDRLSIKISGLLNPYILISINEYLGSHFRTHEAYGIVEAYLSVKSSDDTKRFKAEMQGRNNASNKMMLSMDEYQKTTDVFNGVKITWYSGKTVAPPRSTLSYFPEPDRKYYKLMFHKRYKEMVTSSYLEHVIKTGKKIKVRNRQRRLYTNGNAKTAWSHVVFEHPATFNTLAMDPDKKEEIMEDLLTFTNSKDFYSRIGKAWKRGYLLYGPPGTGKSSMIAAMANLLDYDVYDLELTSVKDNTELRRLLIETTSKCIIVIEDIDCSLDLTGQRIQKEKISEETGKPKSKTKDESESKVTLSGLLNFIDGLWSACAGERIVIFTTNYVDKLDPALTRRGRMDKHIELSYCKYEGFKVLAKNYLEIEAPHPLFPRVEELIEEVEITPADVAENLMPKSAKDSPEKCLLNLIHSLEKCKELIKDEDKELTKDEDKELIEDEDSNNI